MFISTEKNKKIGYVILGFSDKIKNDFEKYFKDLITEEDYFYAEVGGKKKGGLALEKIHITLFYGLDDEKFNNKEIKNIKVNNVTLGNLELFYIKEFDCCALVLKVNDKKEKLKKIHDKLSKFDVIEEQINKFPFTPHITIAYVKKDFEIKNNGYFKNKKLDVSRIKYKIKN